MLKDRLLQQRKVAKLSQQRVAELAGISQQMIAKLETGAVAQTAHIVELAQALGCSPAYLRDGSDPPTASIPTNNGAAASAWADRSPALRRLADAIEKNYSRLDAIVVESLVHLIEAAAKRR